MKTVLYFFTKYYFEINIKICDLMYVAINSVRSLFKKRSFHNVQKFPQSMLFDVIFTI